MSAALAPLPLEPKLTQAIWGGHVLTGSFGKSGDTATKFGESWECFDENRVADGPYAGRTLGELRAELGPALLGPLDPQRAFPLLTKFIDANASLSVQVHPDDAYARRVEGQPNGKTECWYVLEAVPGASIVLGWKRATSRAEYLERVKEGTLEDVLRHVPVHPGDSFYLPAGTLHAIGAGIVLYETQQTSDLTYRIYDFGRRDATGKPRTLNVDKAADVLDYAASSARALEHLVYELDGLRRTTLVAGSSFVVERVQAIVEPRGLDLEGLPLVITSLDHAIEIEARGERTVLEPYRTAVVPAALDLVMLRSFGGEPAQVLTAAPSGGSDALPRRYSRAAVPVERSTDFLAQF